METFVDHYAVLGIELSANLDAIKKAHRRLALKYHPDKAAPGTKPDSAKFISAQAAYEVLSNVSHRKTYDLQYENRSTAANQTKRATQSHQRGTDEDIGGGFWSHPAQAHGSDGINIPGAYPSDDQSDPDYEYDEDTGVYEDDYADPDYDPYHTSNDTDGLGKSGFDNEGCEDADNQHQFPHDFAEDASPAQVRGNESGPESAYDHDLDDEKAAPQVDDPFSVVLEILEEIEESHCIGETVKGRSHQVALDELRLQKARCKEIDSQLNDLEARLRRRVNNMPAGSVNVNECNKSLKQRMNAAHCAVRDIQLDTEHTIFVVRFEQKPRSWKATDKTTRGVVNTIQNNAGLLWQMKRGLPGLESIVGKMEGFANSDLRQLKGCLDNFMSELRDWCEEIASRQ